MRLLSIFADSNVSVDVNKLAEQLAKLAGPIAAQGWDIYVRQQYVEGFQNLFSALVWFIIATVLLCWVKWKLLPWAKNYQYSRNGDTMFSDQDQGMTFTVPVVCTVLAGLCLFFFLLNVNWAIAHFANPGYGAIQEILGR